MRDLLNLPLTLPVLLGASFALPYLALARSQPDHERRAFAAGLIVAAAIYPPFALFAGKTGAVLVELGGLLLFGGLAALGLLRWPVVLAFGWAAHVAWDLLLHPVEPTPAAGVAGSGYIAWWYPLLCVGFDLLVAGYLLGRLEQLDEGPDSTLLSGRL